MENQNQSSSKTQPQKQQSKSNSPGITQNRTRKENTQNASNTDTGENTSKTENIQPKFQSKHKNRNVNPPQTKEAAKSAETEESGPAVQKPGTATMPQSQSKRQTGESNPSSAENETQSTDGGRQSSKLGSQAEQSPEEATNNNGSGTVVPPQSHFSSEDDNTSSKPPKGKKKWLVAAIVVALLILGIGGYTAYAHYVAPRKAPVSYMQKLADMQSGQYQIKFATVDGDSQSGVESGGDEQARRPGVVPDENTELSEEQQGAQLPGGVPDPEINLQAEGEFSNDQNNPENSQFSSTINVEYDQSFLNINQSFDFRFRDSTGYVRFENADLLSFFLPGIKAGEWYSWEVNNEEAAKGLSPVQCTEEDRQALTEYFENEATDKVKITNPKRNDWFGVKRNDTRVRHYSGEITGTSLVNLLQGAADATSKECIASEDINETELNELNFVYDLYTGNDRDEMVLRVFKDDEEQGEIALTTSGYNQEVDIPVPENSTPVEELLRNGAGQNENFQFDLNSGGNAPGSSTPSGDSLFESNLQ